MSNIPKTQCEKLHKGNDNLFWLLPLLTAVAARGIVYYLFINSPFRFYHTIKGLDMYSIYTMYPDSTPSIYYIFLRIISFLINKVNFIETVILIQLLLGILAVLMIYYVAYSLTENKYIACFSGLIYGLYSPEMMYELFLLKEAFYLFMLVLVLFCCFSLCRKNFSKLSMFLLGSVILLPGFTRVTGGIYALLVFLWLLYSILKYAKSHYNSLARVLNFVLFRFLIFFFGLTIISCFVYYSSGNSLPAILSSYSNVGYFFKVGQQNKIKSINSEKRIDKKAKVAIKKNINFTVNQNKVISSFKNYLRNIALTFRAYEIPNNINYYFVKEKLLPLKYFLGPLLLFPFAIAGLFIIILCWKNYKKPELLIVYIIPVIASCVFFVPAGRYRIVLLPVLAIASAVCIKSFYFYFSKKRYIKFSVLALLIYLIGSLEYFFMEKSFYRASDYVAYGQALSYYDTGSQVIFNSFETAYKIRPDLNYTKTNLIIECLKTGRFEYAEKLIEPEYKKYPNDFTVAVNFAAALLGRKNYSKAKEVLLKIKKPDNADQLNEYLFNLAEFYFLTGDYLKAESEYKLLLSKQYGKNLQMQDFISKRLIIIQSKK